MKVKVQKKETLLEVKNLKVGFDTDNGPILAVNDVSFKINKGEIVAIVGESGSGKSVTANSIMGLISAPGKINSGEILFDQKNLVSVSLGEMRSIRGNDISMIFQEPMTSLNPLFTVGDQIEEAIRLHQKVSRKEAKEKTIEMLKKVGIPRSEKVYSSYPHLLSGGMRQRVMIAMALSCNPRLLIADEPTTALDVTIQAQILELMKDIIREQDTSIILITHDLGVVAEMADRVIVMYAGQVVEEADVFKLFKQPNHPYTKGLLNSTPKIHEMYEELISIEGIVPSPSEMPSGCFFHPRCPEARTDCSIEAPQLLPMGTDSSVRCWLHNEQKEKEAANQ
ncbi:ABC transporter ATP-binding protein [Bacillus sp. JJ1503]|uniref:ABC transporter ATP-binding protein n=1 Tax=unclassified Bacillus (in: firmicutes) TaxID=185979 RepID=UPI002FFF9F9E